MNQKGDMLSNLNKKSKYIKFILTLIKWIFLGSIIGIIVGSTSALLLNLNDFLTSVRERNGLLLFLLPLGGIVIGYIYQYHGKNSHKGNDLIIEHVHHGQGQIPFIMGPITFIATAITHLFGGSTGREGAAIQMGTSIAEAVKKVFKIDKIDRRILIMSGISSGFGSAFAAPLTGTIFGIEVISQGKLKYEAIIPCYVSSFVGYLITEAWGVQHEEHIIKMVPDLNMITIAKVIIASILFSFASILYSQLRHGVKNFCEKHLKNLMLRAAIGGVVIIALTYVIGSKDYLGRGLPIVDQAFEGQVTPFTFLNKIIFTAITMGTGFRGGEAIPLFFIGATLGNTLSTIMNLPTSFLAAIGLISVFCGAVNTPISCLILSIELFKGKGIIYFFMACLISYIFSRHNSIYASQKIYEPKSRLLGLSEGEKIKSTKEK